MARIQLDTEVTDITNAPTRVPVHEGSESEDYHEFYLREMACVPEEKLAYTQKPGNPEDALRIEDKNRLLDPGYLPDEVGYYLLESGAGVVANNTKFAGSTGAMLQWWFAWHCLDPLRYAIWDPFDHYDTEITDATRAKIMDPGTSIPEKCFGVDHTVTESLVKGGPAMRIEIHFRDPEEMGFDKSKLGTDALSFIVCANVEIVTPEGEPNVPVVMVHTARDIEGGCELRSRFWTGYQIVGREPVYLLPPGMQFPEPVLQQLLAHNFCEYTNLAAILPEVYRQQGGRLS